jgi:DNA-binding CsgD family transcriptional regulator
MALRELQVVARVKVGMSARQIAAELGIAETTVITHRSSTYARMGVANLRELLLAKDAFRRLVAKWGSTTPSCAVSRMACYPTAQMLGAKVPQAAFVPAEHAPTREYRAEC